MPDSSTSQDAEAVYSKAAKAEFSKDYDLAFGLYIKATELFLHLARTGLDNEPDKIRMKTKASKALERAEKIKALTERIKSSSQRNPDNILTPVGVNHFSAQEQSYVLKKGERINGLTFPQWTQPTRQISTELFVDPDGQPSLSPEQLKLSPVWRRPPSSIDASSDILDPQLIRQHITDCSLCASLSVCLEHSRRFGSSCLDQSQSPGRYDLKFYFNGSWRRVTIDDRLPYHPTLETLMCMSYSSSQSIIWPSLLEKGVSGCHSLLLLFLSRDQYMKMMGGYDFPGSNSSIDLHAIAGWVPDHVEIRRPGFEREAIWRNIYDGFINGQCMLTVGTGQRDHIQWNEAELLQAHSYAVLDVQEDEDEERYLAILDSATLDGSLQENAVSRILQIPWSDVLNVFDGIYISWDPQIWNRSISFNGMWKFDKTENYCTRHLRVKFSSGPESSDDIWILLTRHVLDTRQTSDFGALKVQVEDETNDSAKSDIPSSVAVKGTYTNSPHVLVKTRIPSTHRSGFLSIYASIEGQSKEIGFTLTAYASNIDISWDERVPKPPFTCSVDGSFTSKTAGGNAHNPSFMTNPQYHLQIHPPKVSASRPKADLSFILQASRNLPVNVAVAWSQGERVFELFQKDIAASSGTYSYGFARADKKLPVGDYTIILSAFEPLLLGPYSFKVESSLPCDLIPIHQEDAGMYTRSIRGTWDAKTAAGGPGFKRYTQNPVFELDVPVNTQVKVRLQLVRPSSSTAINITMFPSSETGSLGRHLTTSGGYHDGISGVVTPQISLKPGKYWMIPSTYNPDVKAEFLILAYSTAPGISLDARK
ncbi:hypothetical protein C8J56DRAFT_1016524 [Mycena floridula]|nr:hypothetical protein C8J56DRAFT_1016524 [Mycena floridula]